MEAKLLDNLPFSIDKQALIERLRLDEELLEDFEPLWDEALSVARPRLVYGRAEAKVLDERNVQVGGEAFVSRVLATNLKGAGAAYPYVATCGRELYALSQSKDDALERYWVDAISEEALRSVLASGLQHIREAEGDDQLYAMNPGSLPDWPISQQRPLFRLLGDVMGLVGVELTESFLMLPVKSVSGLMFASDVHYTNCSLCPREGCVGRREPFDEVLFRETYALDEA